MKRRPKILFILKLRHQYNGDASVLKSSGLLNSARFVRRMLDTLNYNTKLVQVVDNNSIDKEVHSLKPDIAIVEALWVVPEKFEVLRKLHPNVKWIVRIHSELPFLANEGIAMEWINKCISHKNVYVAFNSLETYEDYENYMHTRHPKLKNKILYMPNYYPVSVRNESFKLDHKDTIDVGCFGSLRPMKNQLIQAFAAIEYAKSLGLGLRFHINATRLDNQSSHTVLKNLRELFDGMPPCYKLVEHEWMEHQEFLDLIKTMDIGLQLSMSETFNIVAADFVSQGIPIVVSSEIDWLPKFFHAESTHVDSIIKGMHRVLFYKKWFDWTQWPKRRLKKICEESIPAWKFELEYLLHKL